MAGNTLSKLYGSKTQWSQLPALTEDAVILVNLNDIIYYVPITEFKGEKGNKGDSGNVVLPDGLVVSSLGYNFLAKETVEEWQELLELGTAALLNTGTGSNDVIVGNDLRLLPVGAIVMWSGAPNDIPEGWYICNGTSGTPDYRDRFPVGAGGSYNVGSVGGINEVLLTAAQSGLREHLHTVTDPGHYHSYIRQSLQNMNNSGDDTDDRNAKSLTYGTNTGTSSTGISVNPITASSALIPHENRPPFIATYFIQFKNA